MPRTATGTAAKRSGMSLNTRNTLVGMTFILPNFIGFFCFVLIPVAFSFVLSFMEWDGFTEMKFVGIENFLDIFDDRVFRAALVQTVIFSIFTVAFSMVLALALGTFSTAMWSYYYSSTMNDLKRRAADDAGGFASFTRSQYWTNAQNAVQKFEDKTKLELQFLDDTGAVQYSSNDLAAGTTPGTQDIQSALNYQEAVAWKGTDPHTGERVVAASAPIVYHGQTVAVVRYVTSLVAIDWQFFLAMGLACLLGAAILALVYFSNLYFVRSIVEPLASITETARLIADGSYGVQIEKKFDDEVGEAYRHHQRYVPKNQAVGKDTVGVHLLRLP